MAQSYTREKLSAAAADGAPIDVGTTAVTIHSSGSGQQDSVKLSVASEGFNNAPPIIRIYTDDGTDVMDDRYIVVPMGGTVEVEFENIQPSVNIKAVLANEIATSFWPSSPFTDASIFTNNSAGGDMYIINNADMSVRTVSGTPNTAGGLNYFGASGEYDLPTNGLRYAGVVKTFPSLGLLLINFTSGTNSGWHVYDLLSGNWLKSVSGPSATSTYLQHYYWNGNKLFAPIGSTTVQFWDFSDPLNPTQIGSNDTVTTFSGHCCWTPDSSVWIQGLANGVQNYKADWDAGTVTAKGGTWGSTGNGYQTCCVTVSGTVYAYTSSSSSSYNGYYCTVGPDGTPSGATSSANLKYCTLMPFEDRGEVWAFNVNNVNGTVYKWTGATSTDESANISGGSPTTWTATNQTNVIKGFDDTNERGVIQDTVDNYIVFNPATKTWMNFIGNTIRSGADIPTYYGAIVNDGSNDYIIGFYSSNIMCWHRWDNNTQDGSTVGSWAYHSFENCYHAGSNEFYAFYNGTFYYMELGAASQTGTATDHANSTTVCYRIGVDDTNDKLYYFTNDLYVCDVNATTGALSNHVDRNVGGTTDTDSWSEAQWDFTGGFVYVPQDNGDEIYKITLSSGSSTTITPADTSIAWHCLNSASRSFSTKCALKTSGNGFFFGFDEASDRVARVNLTDNSCAYWDPASEGESWTGIESLQYDAVNDYLLVMQNGDLYVINASTMATASTAYVGKLQAGYDDAVLVNPAGDELYLSGSSGIQKASVYPPPSTPVPLNLDDYATSRNYVSGSKSTVYQGGQYFTTYADPTTAEQATLVAKCKVTGRVNRVTTT